MKFTLSWLKEHLDTNATLDEISRTLTAIGLEVENVEDAAAELAAFTVAEILEAHPHPDADKLRVCNVESGEGVLQIVCGAPNAREGIKVALAKVGSRIPNGDFKIKKSKIRGVESCGMLCSARELNLGQDHDGIMELSADAVIGEPIARPLGLDDPLIEIAITPNRGDCLGVYGIARDLAAAGVGTLKPLTLPFSPGRGNEEPLLPGEKVATQSPDEGAIKINLQTPHCAQFIGIRIDGVQNGPAPDWLQRKLTAIGLRPISALVDITNYFTHAYGRPLHVYDADKLTGGIIVREALAGETFEALNDKSYTLKGGECVIADEAGVLGLGGIVGGVPSSVSETTTNLLLECAWFEPEAIARAGRAHDILTDARYRFERTVDPGFMQPGTTLAAEMIQELCGGKVRGMSVAGEVETKRAPIQVHPDAINRLSGMPIAADEQKNILTKLGFSCHPPLNLPPQGGEGEQREPEGSGTYLATPPSWRADVTGVADVAEEILRMYGYDTLPAISLPKPDGVSKAAVSPEQHRQVQVRRVLAQRGLMEGRHWAFMAEDKAALFADILPEMRLQNPISSDLGHMRPTLLAHLIDAATRNHSRGYEQVALFEVGPVFHGTAPEDQQNVAAALRAGVHITQQWNHPALSVNWTHAKADALAILAACGVDTARLHITRDAPGHYHPGRSGALKLGPKKTLAYFGELHPIVLQAMDVDGPIVACEVMIDAIPPAKARTAQPLSRSDYPSVDRDFAFILPVEAEAEELLRAVSGADKSLIQSVRLFDVYQGKGLNENENEKSLALRVRLQAEDRTLTDAEIEAVSRAIINAAEKVGASLRA